MLMKKAVLVYAVALMSLVSCRESTESYISKLAGETIKHQSVNYKVTEKYYYSDTPDTTVTPLEVWVVRDSSDKMRKGYIWVNNYYRPSKIIYDAGNCYLVILQKNTTVQYPDFKEPLISAVDWTDIFLNPGLLEKYELDSTVRVDISDTVYQGKDCARLLVEFPKGNNGETKKQTYILDKKHMVPLWAQLESGNNDRVYYDELTFSDYAFDQVNLAQLKQKQKEVLKENPIDPKGAFSILEGMLQLGDKAPLFTGKFLSNGNQFEITDYIGKNVIIVDFWYTHCPPCVRSMPLLSELYDQYKDKGLKIFGLNTVDNQPGSLENLKKFLSKRKVSYDIILTKPAVDLMYKVKGYPTMYVIDRNGKIAEIEFGFNEEKFKEMKTKIIDLLK